ncbi:GntR family transcriptional regulator [Micromonospora robiginosa]|uniref:GntR family transcriptional regulator n=1 Tax=Micromonospora robiginosa TaxID=2749844 RepID=A0A7L6B3Z0_9ACTN|nr:GntR family transcriptional regulator [Micromonospora ferruginea]QLQ36584.1 GntR family transcriptional regulator [Micromonospora ferruginea]
MNAVEHAYAALRQGILDGTYAPGAQLAEVELATSLAVSRTPVREAIRRLHSEGLIDVFPNRGAYVRRWSRAQLDELFSVRALLEGHAAALAAHHATDEQRAAMAALCDDMDTAATPHGADIQVVAALNDRFHALVHEASDNSLLPGMIRGLIQVPVVVRTFVGYSPNRLQISMQQHREILTAIRSHDAPWAESAMRTHILSARHELDSSV